MRLVAAVLLALTIGACQRAQEPNPYPEESKAAFNRDCPAGDPVCDCTWDGITRAMTHEEWNAAIERALREGLLDPELSRISTECKERHSAG